MDSRPLVVDLDGTLLRTDMLHESALAVLREHPLDLLRIPGWLGRGKAALKAELARRISIDPSVLPYHVELVAWLREQRAARRPLVLCTASDRSIALPIAEHLGLFDEVMASDGQTNLAGAHKARALAERYGERGFDYAGNAPADLAVWAVSQQAVVVAAPPGLAAKAAERCAVEREFAATPRQPGDLRRFVRGHQWLKNLLLFVPLFAAHQIGEPLLWGALALAFVAFSLVASGIYILNDLLDLDSDRRHPRKRERPLAAGRIPAWIGVVTSPLLVALGLALGALVGPAFAGWLLAYLALTCAYSWGLKRLPMLDCLALALLYTLRIVAGAAAVGLTASFWLLAFSLFLFLSLAFVKRYAELLVQRQAGVQRTPGRGYATDDAPLVQTLGVAAGFASVVVLALYINSDAVLRLYTQPMVLWAAVPVLLYWVSWIWLKAHRGEMHDDPLVFALKNPASLAAGAAFGGVLALASVIGR